MKFMLLITPGRFWQWDASADRFGYHLQLSTGGQSALHIVHELLVDPQTEVLREKQAIDLPDEKAVEWAGLAPAMVGAEWVDTDFIAAVWTLFHDAFVREVRGRSEPVEEILRLLAPGQALLEHRVHFHLVENRQEEKTPFAFLATYSRTAMQQRTEASAAGQCAEGIRRRYPQARFAAVLRAQGRGRQ